MKILSRLFFCRNDRMKILWDPAFGLRAEPWLPVEVRPV